MKPSTCGRFFVLDALHIDREVLGPLARWTEQRGLGIQDAVQLAILFFTDHALTCDASPPNADRTAAARALLERAE